jgi:BolA family transcriptional regulator, general stress-responsive regulator
VTDRVALIRARLEAAFDPVELEVIDESHLHVGHAGARDGRGHFRVRLVSAKFSGANPIERHRMVFETLDDLMTTDIHALSLKATAPAQRN